jgi:hypothetical protein
MCGRVVQVSDPIKLSIVDGLGVRETRLSNYPRRWNGAPSQELLVIRENHDTGERSIDLLKWGLIPHWCADPKGGRKPINAKSETVAKLPVFRDGYRRRRFILPVDAFYEWKAIKGRKQPYAIAMKGPLAIRYRRHLGKLEEPARRLGAHLRDTDDAWQRARRHHSRPHASGACPGGLRPLARK